MYTTHKATYIVGYMAAGWLAGGGGFHKIFKYMCRLIYRITSNYSQSRINAGSQLLAWVYIAHYNIIKHLV